MSTGFIVSLWIIGLVVGFCIGFGFLWCKDYYSQRMILKFKMETVIGALEHFPDMQDGRMEPEELREAASEWWWETGNPLLLELRKRLK